MSSLADMSAIQEHNIITPSLGEYKNNSSNHLFDWGEALCPARLHCASIHFRLVLQTSFISNRAPSYNEIRLIQINPSPSINRKFAVSYLLCT